MNIKVLSRKQSCSPQLKGILLPAVTGLGFFLIKMWLWAFISRMAQWLKCTMSCDHTATGGTWIQTVSSQQLHGNLESRAIPSLQNSTAQLPKAE